MAERLQVYDIHLKGAVLVANRRDPEQRLVDLGLYRLFRFVCLNTVSKLRFTQ